MDKAASVRRLRRTNTSFVESRGVSNTKPKPIIAGILAKESIDPNSGKLSGYLRTEDPYRLLQFGCCIDSAFVADGNAVSIHTGEAPLYWFFYNLLSKLQSIGSVPAIDYSDYLAHIV